MPQLLKKKITFKDIVTFITSLSMLLVIFFGVSMATTVENVRDIFHVPAKVDQLIQNDSIIYHHILESEHSTEMMWELFRLMTDDNDTLAWFYADDIGEVHNVDIRSTAEEVDLAFVFEGHKIYPVFKSPADDRRYIIRRNGGEDYNTYLFVR